MPDFRNAPISRKLTLAFMLMSTSTVLTVSAVFIAYQWYMERYAVVSDLTSFSEVIANNSTAALSFGDPGTASEVLRALKARKQVELACLYITEGTASVLFAEYIQQGIRKRCPIASPDDSIVFSNTDVAIARPVMLDKSPIGRIYISQNLDELWNSLKLLVEVVLVVFLVALLLSLLAASAMQRFITQPLLRLTATTQKVTETRDYGLRAPPSGKDEVGQLVGHFNTMLAEIEARDDEVLKARGKLEKQVAETNQANAELQNTLKQLKDAQVQLVQSEKMASLGGLVAGVAHEINTPVGIGVTAASTLKSRTHSLREAYTGKKLTESALEKYMDIASQSSDIILTNLARAAELIHSFKQVAVDQTNSEHRNFNLHEYLDEILLSLRPRLKRTPYEVEIDCPAEIEVSGYPGALSQILTNFIMNSLLHGFEGREEGHITIHAEQQGENICLKYADDGIGISQDNLARVFDPFFTTKRGTGGSGLGLHIVYNLVTHTLKGKISVSSEPGKGTRYVIVFPVYQRSPNEHA